MLGSLGLGAVDVPLGKLATLYVCIGVILEICWGYIGMMEKWKHIIGLLGLHSICMRVSQN